MLRLGRKFDHRATPLSLFDSNYNKPLAFAQQANEAKDETASEIKGLEIPIDAELYEQIVNGSFELPKQEPEVADSRPKERDSTSVDEFELKQPTLKGSQEILLNIDIEFALDQ